MSVQFGKCNFDGTPLTDDFERAHPLVAPFGPDGVGSFKNDTLGILYRAFWTTKESRREAQPHVCSGGTIITFDGRLDNREDLVRQLKGAASSESTDIEIVAAAYELWRTLCFSKLLGDWAISVVEPREQSVILAKDFLGTRHLYYSIEGCQLTWCTILDPLLLLSRRSFNLNREYIAGWLSYFPAPQLTPYEGIHSVPPASFVRVTRETCRTFRHWDFDERKRIRYERDAEYEEQFRAVFTESVRRRLRSDCPVLAELSGGMDSSSIVCVGDSVIARGESSVPRLDTLSYYDDSEPNWDERPYFSQVEEKRGRQGCHIDISASASRMPTADADRFGPVPGVAVHSNDINQRFSACLTVQGNRVLLSGIGGDEMAGGVPTPTQELADLLCTFALPELPHKLKLWALAQRRPWFHLVGETARAFLPRTLVGLAEYKRPPAWLHPELVDHFQYATAGFESRLKFWGGLPSFQDNVATLNAMRRQLACEHPTREPLYETRYPFLDRDLLDFLFAIPREQLVRPGQRRSLMRRSLIGIVPEALLNRRRKAYVARAPMAALSADASRLIENSEEMASTRLGFVDAKAFSAVVQKAKEGQMVLMVPLRRALELECWLQALIGRGLIHQPSCAQASRDQGHKRAVSFSRAPRNPASWEL